MIVTLSSRAVFRAHLAAIALLTIAHLAIHALNRLTGHAMLPQWLVAFLDVDAEHNLPTLFSAVALVAAAGASAVAAGRASVLPRLAAGWRLLAIVLLALAVDEGAALHERLTDPVREGLGVGGVLYFAWMIPYALIGMLVLLRLAGFLAALDESIRGALLRAGAVFVAGAVGFEMLSGALIEAQGWRHPLLRWTTTAEEALEMLGVALYLRAAIEHVERGTTAAEQPSLAAEVDTMSLLALTLEPGCKEEPDVELRRRGGI